MAVVNLSNDLIGTSHAGKAAAQVYRAVLDAHDNPIPNGDTVTLAALRNQVVERVRYVVERAEGSALTFGLGDSTSDTTFFSLVDANVEGATDVTADGAGEFYDADGDEIIITPSAAVNNLRLVVFVQVINLD